MAILTLPHANQIAHSVRAKALVFEDPRSQQLLHRIQQVAPSSASVLITGETGTGKEIVARHLHDLSLRRQQPFAAVNCGAFSETLVESELFGHERGAFTGADRAKAGWFEAASGGTLFLDEVGDLPPSIQVKLLRVLQENEVVRLGSRTPIPIDVRLIAATNVDLEQAIDAGHFREDLFYRLHVTTLTLLPLRERRGDIPPLAHYFADLYAKRLGLDDLRFAADALDRLHEHNWPGNIRELENVIHNAALVCRDGVIAAEHLHIAPSRRKLRESQPPPAPPSTSTPEQTIESGLRALFEAEPCDLYERIDSLVFRSAYDFCERNQLQTSRLLGLSRNIVRARLAQYGQLQVQPRTPGSARVNLSLHTVSRAHPRVLRVGFQRFGLLLLVKAAGSLELALAELGVRIEWTEYPAGPDILAALEDGRLDIGVAGECPPVYAQAARVPFVYVAAESPAPDAEAIIVHAESEIRSMADLRGKRVGLNAGANVHYLLIRALEEANVGYDEISLRFGSPEQTGHAFHRREVDAWAIWDPMLANVQRATPTRVLRDAHGLTQNAAYYVASRSFADKHPELVDLVVEHVAKTGREARKDPDAFALQHWSELGISREGLALALRRHRGTGPMTEELLDGQQRIADALHRLHFIPHAITVADARWAPRLAG